MKKENKQLAQKRRAEEKKKQTTKKVLSTVCKIGIPTLLLLILIGICIANPGTLSGTSNDSDIDTSSYTVDTSYEIQNGDTVNIDYVGSVDGEVFEDTEGTGAMLTIGSGTYIDDFEEQLIGAHPGETVEVNVTFPEGYSEELSGKDATFEVTINGLYES